MKKHNAASVTTFDYSRLSGEFSKLGKPAQRALLNNGIRTPEDLAKRTLEEVLGFHGIGNSSVPILRAVLKEKGIAFRKSSSN